jgi:hypothetical protein
MHRPERQIRGVSINATSDEGKREQPRVTEEKQNPAGLPAGFDAAFCGAF